jgi:hypothetical protein
MPREDLERLAAARPFQPFEVRLVDGRVFRFRSPEQFLVGRSTLVTLDEEGCPVHINIGLIATIRVRNGSRRSR